MRTNPLLRTDSYKYSHHKQYPPGTTMLQSYIESRGHDGIVTDSALFFGLQYFLKEYLSQPFTGEDLEQARIFCEKHFGRNDIFPYEGFRHILRQHGGWMPVEIKAVPEGAIVPLHNLLVSIRSTDAKVPWIVSWLETQLLRAVWYPTTVATNSLACKRIIYKNLLATADAPDAEIGFKLHDFGARGVSSTESAALGGAAHLVNFLGSDTCEGIELLANYYSPSGRIPFLEDVAGFSIPASEHSTITAWGRDHEAEAFGNMIKQFLSSGSIVACVSDSYDIYAAIEHLWGEQLHDAVIASGGTLVVRPDSGDPTEVVIKCLEGLEAKFGTTLNSKGYKVLNHVRVIQGDGVDWGTINYILDKAKHRGYAGTNLAFGMGGGLLQKVNRDSLKFANKTSLIEVQGELRPVYKQPVTAGFKKSRAGDLDLIMTAEGKYLTIDRLVDAEYAEHPSMIQTVYRNGDLYNKTDLATVRAIAARHLALEFPQPELIAH